MSEFKYKEQHAVIIRVDSELVCHLAVTPLFTAKAYRATRLVVMPEWQGAGLGNNFVQP